MKLLRSVLLLVVAALGAGFVYINPKLVNVSYYFGEIALPVGILIFLLFGAGMLTGVLASTRRLMRLKRENAALRRVSELAHLEVDNLRTVPLPDR